ncbi:MAG: cytochrome c [Desulforhopalus sp.]
MKKAAMIFLFLASIGVVYAGGLHNEGHHQKETNAHWQAPQEAINQANPIPADKSSIELGGKIYVELCARCHGENAQGDGPDASSLSTRPTNLKAMSGGHADGDFAWKIRNGRGDMPAWDEEFDDAEIWSLVNYIQSLSKHGETTESTSHKSTDHTEHNH